MADLRNLRVLEGAEDLAADLATVCESLVAKKAPGLRDQILRAGESIPANIAEGAGQGTDPQLARGLRLALGSANELGVHLRRARRTGALDPIAIARCESKRVILCKMMARMLEAVEQRIAAREAPRASSA